MITLIRDLSSIIPSIVLPKVTRSRPPFRRADDRWKFLRSLAFPNKPIAPDRNDCPDECAGEPKFQAEPQRRYRNSRREKTSPYHYPYCKQDRNDLLSRTPSYERRVHLERRSRDPLT